MTTPQRAADDRDGDGHDRGRLGARPSQAPKAEAGPPGVQPLGLRTDRDTLLQVPSGHRLDRPLTLVVSLHGAGGDARGGLAPLARSADELGILLLAPASLHSTWDVLAGGFGPDVELIDRALARTFELYAVDPGRVVVAGFSDGASYALSIGITNGDLFRSVLAFSPGFAAPGRARGSPRLFITHGTHDPVLPINSTSRKVVPRFRRDGYEVQYHEFEGGHTVPPELARTGLVWAQGLVNS